MKRLQFLKRIGPRFLIALALVGMIVYTVYHVIGSSPESLMTTPVEEITDTQLLTADAYLFRDEQIVVSPSYGVIEELAANGAKVGAGVPVAAIYPAGNNLEEQQSQLDRVERLIATLERCMPSAGTPLSEVPKLREAAAEDYLAIRRAVAAGSLSGVSDLEQELSISLNRYYALTESAEGMKLLLEGMKELRAELLTGDPETVRNGAQSGYFYDRTHLDGYEGIFTAEALEELTVSSFEELIAAEPRNDVEGLPVGKLIRGSRWHVAIRVTEAAMEYFAPGYSYVASFTLNGGKELTLTCERILTEKRKEGAVILLSTDDFPADFIYARAQSIKLEVESTSGYYIPDSALHTLNGVEGVYVFENRTAYFRRIIVLYRGDGYCIASPVDEQGEALLHLNDLIITYGQNLHDGKVY